MLEQGATADEVWVTLIREIHKNGLEVSPRGIPCRELLAHHTHVDMGRPITTTRPRIGYRFMVAEAWWILTGRNDVESIKPYSPHIASFSDDGIRFDGAYGPRVVDQLRYVVDSLEQDPDTRQAVIDIWRSNPRKSRDVPCTLTLQWLIRDGKLHCVDNMRSSDAWLGWVYDVFNMSMISAYIALVLRARDKARCDGVSWPNQQPRPLRKLELGTLHLVAGSQHLYHDNVAYRMADVERVLDSPLRQVPYEPLNLDEFESPHAFVRHLELCKDGRGNDRNWLSEFQVVPA